MVWVIFALSAAIAVAGGTKLSQYGDRIAEYTGLGRLWTILRAMSKLRAYAGVARAPFLLLPVTLISAGAAAAFYEGAFSWWSTLLALIGLVALHMAVNIFNEWSDLRTGIDLATERTPFSGGSGTLPAGVMSPRAALSFGIACSAVGLLIGLFFLARVGTIMLPIMIAGALCVLIYTDVLARMGIGEVAAGLGLGGLPVVGAALVNSGGFNQQNQRRAALVYGCRSHQRRSTRSSPWSRWQTSKDRSL